jgi:DNA-binding NarL/FixJ family response regulator
MDERGSVRTGFDRGEGENVAAPPSLQAEHRPFRIMLIDDHAVFREGIAAVLAREADLRVVAEASNEASAISGVAAAAPDAIIVDLSLGESTGGLALIKALREQCPDTGILVLSMHDEGVYAERSLRAGADGYLMKHEGAARLLLALRTVLAHRTYVSPEVSASIVARLRGAPPVDPASGLSDRQLEVFRLFGQGLGTKEVAARLRVSVKTIETHRAAIKVRLGLQGASELVAYAATWVARNAEPMVPLTRTTRPPKRPDRRSSRRRRAVTSE